MFGPVNPLVLSRRREIGNITDEGLRFGSRGERWVRLSRCDEHLDKIQTNCTEDYVEKKKRVRVRL